MAKPKTAPIVENEHVKEILAVMRENNAPTMRDLLAILNQVGAMEGQLDVVVNDLAEAWEQSHPVKTPLQNVVKTLEKNVATLRERLDELKQNITQGFRFRPPFKISLMNGLCRNVAEQVRRFQMRVVIYQRYFYKRRIL